MRTYEIDLTVNGVTSAIDTITAGSGYTAEQYIKDCENNADAEWCEMINSGEITITEVE